MVFALAHRETKKEERKLAMKRQKVRRQRW